MCKFKIRYIFISYIPTHNSVSCIDSRPEVLKVGGGASCLCEGHIYLGEIWTEDKIYILVGTLRGWNTLLITQYRYWLRTVSNSFCYRLNLAYFLCRITPTNKNEVALLSHLIFFSYYYADERNYCALDFIFIYRPSIPYCFASRIVISPRQMF
jgi:hypothetical protein